MRKHRIVFMDSEGNINKNAIYSHCLPDGEIVYFEILGQTKLNGVKVTIDSKEPFRRILIKRVYPHIDEECLNDLKQHKIGYLRRKEIEF